MAPRTMQGKLVSGKDKVAALVLSLSDENKQSIFKQLKEREVWMLSSSMTALGVIEPIVLHNVLTDFMTLMKQGTSVVGSFDGTKKMLESVLGKEKASSLLQGVVADNDGVWEQLSEVNAVLLSQFLKREDMQTTSVILSRLTPSRTAHILGLYDADFSIDILVRMLTAAPIKGQVLSEIQNFLKTEFMEEFKRSANTLDAHKVVAEIMNAFDQKKSDQLLSELEKQVPEAVAKVRNLMFTFDDLMRIEPSDIQKIVSAIDKTQLGVALKGVNTMLQELFFSNMSERAAKLLKSDMADMGAVRVTAIEKAQRAILEETKNLQRAGTITIPDASDAGGTVE